MANTQESGKSRQKSNKPNHVINFSAFSSASRSDVLSLHFTIIQLSIVRKQFLHEKRQNNVLFEPRSEIWLGNESSKSIDWAKMIRLFDRLPFLSKSRSSSSALQVKDWNNRIERTKCGWTRESLYRTACSMRFQIVYLLHSRWTSILNLIERKKINNSKSQQGNQDLV